MQISSLKKGDTRRNLRQNQGGFIGNKAQALRGDDGGGHVILSLK